ncbi:PLP-dependent aminotransferase family protein [Nonomuraea sp. NN258]|uniref:aminotransferase-like domain-containing protein n=1 Tax=Nonomuraea antri TaxID=2730852 RepID=UPI0015684F37|nr:PLP-dependent aminotransferase family protein [Nonomuraea antri]NRQ33121.1 PLP-dependent aminotransferase family protein [Nonomuraea antri]
MSENSTSDELATALRAAIATMAPGDRLPSSRDLTRRHRVGPATVARAIAQLAAEGAVITRPGSGTYVAARPGRATRQAADTSWQAVALAGRDVEALPEPSPVQQAGVISLAGGYPHESLQPVRALQAALARAARRPDAWHRAPTEGLAPLRTIFAGLVGGTIGPDDVLITGGSQGALSMLFRAIIAPGGPVLMEAPTYPGALHAARAAGLRPLPVPIDDDGLRPDLLADAFAMTGARLLYCQPTYHNPTGAVLPPARREQVAEIARAAGAFVIEDDWARHLSHNQAAPRPMVVDDRDGTVIHLTSLTKPASPSLRIGAVIARGPVMRRLRSMRHVDDFFTARPLQEAAIELISGPAWDRHLRMLPGALRERAATLAAALAREVPGWRIGRHPAGGLHLWVHLPDGHEDTAVVAAARAHGVAVDRGSRFFPADPPHNLVRLSFAAAADLAELGEAARRLRAAADELPSSG